MLATAAGEDGRQSDQGRFHPAVHDGSARPGDQVGGLQEQKHQIDDGDDDHQLVEPPAEVLQPAAQGFELGVVAGVVADLVRDP